MSKHQRMVIEKPLHPMLAAEIDADVRSATSPAAIAAIVAAMDRYPVGAFRNAEPVSDAEHIAFSLWFGPVERMTARPGRPSRLTFPEIIDQGNLDENGEIFADDDRRMPYKRANRLWHTDMSFHACRATYSLLSAHVIPPSGAAPTEIADMRAAYDALSAALKGKLDGLIAVHDCYHSRVVGGGRRRRRTNVRSGPRPTIRSFTRTRVPAARCFTSPRTFPGS